MGFFIENAPYERIVSAPDGAEGTIKLRRLNAGDQAAIQDTLRMSLSEDADASMALGTMRMLTVTRALIDWDFPGPKPSEESIAQLEPEVFEQIYSFVEIGTPPTLEAAGKPSKEDLEGTATAALPEIKKTRTRAAAAS